jgi:DNA-binding GntR family transcriptional regulator
MSLKFITKNVAVYEALRKDIIEGRLKPGQKIIMSEVAREFGLSDIPVREAIRRLESEGYVHFTPHVGAIVSELDGDKIIELYLIRTELESLATRLAVPHVTSRDIDFLVKKNQEMELAIEAEKLEKLGALNKDFHLRIYRAAPYPTLTQLIEDLWEKMERTQCVFSFVPERAVSSVEEHKKIIEALKAKDTKLAEKLVKNQKSFTMTALQRFIKESYTDYAAEGRG